MMALSFLSRYRITLPIISRAMSSDILYQEKDNVGFLTLNRPHKQNAVTVNMAQVLRNKLLEWRVNEKVEVVCIDGAGGEAFTVGGDIESVTKGGSHESAPLSGLYNLCQVIHLIGTYPKPYVALINGIALGGGASLAVHGKYRVATDKSVYATPETSMGTCPFAGSCYFLSRLPVPYGMFLGLTGYRLKGADLKHMGIATHYTTAQNLTALKGDIEGCDADSVLDTLRKYDLSPLSSFSLKPQDDLIKHCFSASSVLEIISRLEENGTEFAIKLVKTLRRMSPRSLVLTHKLLSIAPSKSFEECFVMDYCIAQQILKSDEFERGVRALVVDKDIVPAWRPSSVEEVTEEMVAEYFTAKEHTWETLFGRR